MIKNKLESLNGAKFKAFKVSRITNINGDVGGGPAPQMHYTCCDGCPGKLVFENGIWVTKRMHGDRWDGHCLEFNYGGTWY